MRIAIAILLGLSALAMQAVPVSAATVADRTKGRILLDVARDGEAWYVSPISGYRYALGSPTAAFGVMRMFGVGITASDLARVATVDAPFDTDAALLPHVRGRILLDVERHGEAWYVDPGTGRRHPLGTPWQAFTVMGGLGLGISSADLAAIPSGPLRGAYVLHDVPFTPQAPFAEWWDQRQDEGCEEASALMAVRWSTGTSLDYVQAREAIIGAAEYQRRTYGSFQDTSVADTADRIFREYFSHEANEVRYDIDVNDIVDELHDGNVVVVGVDARYLGNPHFSYPPPVQHMITVVGYDPLADEFIAHDPGTRFGRAIRYRASSLQASLMDYLTGYREPLPDRPASLISVRKAK